MMKKRSIEVFKNVLSGRTNAITSQGPAMLDVDTLNIMAISGIVLVTGSGDDLVSFYGAIYDECGVDWGKGNVCEICVTKDGVCDASQNKIIAKYGTGERTEDGKEILWSFETNIPHEEILVYDQYGGNVVHAKAILFNVNDLK